MVAVAKVTIKGTAPYTQSRLMTSPRNPREEYDDYERRCWHEKMHLNTNDNVVIPCFALKNMLDEAAKQMNEKISGKGQQTWTKQFMAGVQCRKDLDTGIHKDEVWAEPLFVNADGVRGGGARVLRLFPTIMLPGHRVAAAPQLSKVWGGVINYIITSPVISEDKFCQYISLAGMNVGLGTHAPRRGGFKGTFVVTDMSWRDYGEDILTAMAEAN